MTTATPVTVIVPVYRGLGDVQRCLRSIAVTRRAAMCRFRSSPSTTPRPNPNSPRISTGLLPSTTASRQRSSTIPRISASCAPSTAALRQSPGDVVILNADTVVTERWLDRLAAAAAERTSPRSRRSRTSGRSARCPTRSSTRSGSTGRTRKSTSAPTSSPDTRLKLLPEVITGVGFCMYITREALDLCGLLDEDTFGLGYGEEVDFCLRATRVGLRHLVEDSTFVYHHGAGSFGDERKERLAAASTRLHERYRFFRAANTRERAHDPLRLSFAALELGLVERRADRPHVLHLLHSPPEEIGGTEKHLRVLMEESARGV